VRQVTLYIDVDNTLDIVSELKQKGWVQGKDFDFAYHQSKWDEMIGEIPKQTVFTFYNDSNASYFMLRWG
jgi:hypothetical protein